MDDTDFDRLKQENPRVAYYLLDYIDRHHVSTGGKRAHDMTRAELVKMFAEISVAEAQRLGACYEFVSPSNYIVTVRQPMTITFSGRCRTCGEVFQEVPKECDNCGSYAVERY